MNKTVLVALSMIAGFAVLAPAQTVEELKIKERSSFRAPVTLRNPFWPLGWQKPSPTAPGAPTVARSAATPVPVIFKPDLFTVTSISTGAVPVAVINGRIYGEGELISFNSGGPKPVSAQVYAIKDGMVTLRYQDKTVNVFQKGPR